MSAAKNELSKLTKPVDAGTKLNDHYAKNMARWRFWLRSQMIALVREETNILAWLQTAVRTPLLDVYFAMSANIGTHTFYMVMLPIYFWYGHMSLGEDVVWVLALGVYATGFVKDLLCLPRPRSPPLHRISMSKSAMLEYGFPSTHSCNAISVALCTRLYAPDNALVAYTTQILLSTLILGRVYTGMHGFLDIIGGMLLGWGCFLFREFIKTVASGNYVLNNAVITVVFVIAISISPSPVDDCPCFDDSVAFIGVVIGMMWSRCFCGEVPDFPYFKSTTALPFYTVLSKVIARFAVGVVMIVLWRDLSKRLMLKILPPIWIELDRLGLRNPRRFFITVSASDNVTAAQVRDDIFELPPQLGTIVNNIKRAPQDSVGPQTEADLYEFQTNDANGMDNYTPKAGHIQHGRQHYNFEVFMRLINYGGIGPISICVAPIVFAYLQI